MQHLLLRYTQALLTQMAQTAVCNRHHSVDQQLCRWLLLSLDRLPSNKLTMTQELIANMLGVRREGVTEAAGKLQAAGLIHYSRGRITVLDRPGLEARACECYDVVKTGVRSPAPEYARHVILGSVMATPADTVESMHMPHGLTGQSEALSISRIEMPLLDPLEGLMPLAY